MTTPRQVGPILKAATDYLDAKGIESPRVAAEMLMGRLVRCRPMELPLRFNDTLSEKHIAAMRRGIKRVAGGEPVQHIIGETGFYGHTFKTDKRALIPRPETEVLVEAMLAHEHLWTRSQPVIVDVGTGSGCIAVSLAKARPEALYLAFDISDEALSLARENAKALGVDGQITFSSQDLADALEPELIDGIAANLPYIASDAVAALPIEVRDHEPSAALDGGPDGLQVIETLIEDAGILLKPGGVLFLEIGADQAARVRSLLEAAGFDRINVQQDLAGRDRVVSAQREP